MGGSTPIRRIVGRLLRASAAALLCVLVGAAAWSCSVKDHYQTLSFFFDGVPDPSAPSKGRYGQPMAIDLKASPTYSVHAPFREEKCAACHTDDFQLTGLDSGLCLKCHEPKTRDHLRMHGPVAAAACMWCHLPHESAEASLFKGPSRQVCTQCHETGLLGVEKTPEHADAAKGCLECHFAHGSSAQYFLRPAAGGPAIETLPPPEPRAPRVDDEPDAPPAEPQPAPDGAEAPTVPVGGGGGPG